MIRRFMTTVALGSLFVGGLAASHLAFAQDDGPAGGRRGNPMQMADANKDGNLTKAELTAALTARFAKMDVNGDGKVTKEERDAKRQARFDERFVKLDADKNGQISKTEFAAAHEDRMEKRDERRAEGGKPGGPGGRHMGRGHHRGPGMAMMGGRGADANKDGTLTRDEFMARPIAMFDKADTNRDGTVTAAEMKAARDAMRVEWKDRKGPPPPPQG